MSKDGRTLPSVLQIQVSFIGSHLVLQSALFIIAAATQKIDPKVFNLPQLSLMLIK